MDTVYSLLRKSLRGKKKEEKSPTGIKRSMLQMVRVGQGSSPSQSWYRCEVLFFIFGVRVGIEANQMTVNKWSLNFYRAREKKPECH